MKISIICSNMSNNALGRAYILAKVLEKDFDVEIIGTVRNNQIWGPLSDMDVPYKVVPYNGRHNFFSVIFKLLNLIDGNFIYVSKPYLFNYLPALIKKYLYGTKIVLDIDDGELTVLEDKKIIWHYIKKHSNAQSLIWSILAFKAIPFANKKTVVSSFLKNKYGGTQIYHGRDTDYLNRDNFDPEIIKQQFNISSKKIIMFLGTPREHKGIEDLINVINSIDRNDIIAMIIGIDNVDEYKKKNRSLLSEKILLLPQIKFNELPTYLSCADIVVIPQKDHPFARAQVPAKIFDAMSMAKPIIATNISDNSEILRDCGLIIPPDDQDAMKNAIINLLDNPSLQDKFGKTAREKCIRFYSYKTMEKQLVPLFEEFIEKETICFVGSNRPHNIMAGLKLIRKKFPDNKVLLVISEKNQNCNDNSKLCDQIFCYTDDVISIDILNDDIKDNSFKRVISSQDMFNNMDYSNVDEVCLNLNSKYYIIHRNKFIRYRSLIYWLFKCFKPINSIINSIRQIVYTIFYLIFWCVLFLICSMSIFVKRLTNK